jgi:peroxiredoxin
LRDAVDDLTERDLALAAVGTGDLDYALDFVEQQRITFPVLVDEAGDSYRAVGTRKAAKTALLNPRLLGSGARAVAGGNRQGRPGPRPLVLGATHVIRPDGSVPFAWVNDAFDDDPAVAEVLAALG